MAQDTQVGELLMHWEECRQQGRAVAVEELCADYPELLEELKKGIDALKALDPVLAVTPLEIQEQTTRALPGVEKELPLLEEVRPSPRQIGPYQILSKIGQGGMGTVFRALQKPVNREVALKMVRLGMGGASAVARFYREGKAIARLKHPNVVQIYEFGEWEGLPYFTMELVEGGSLAGRLARGPLPWREAAVLVKDLAQTVAIAHQQQVVHRDLKPANILLTPQGTPKISDFGLAKLVDADDNQTQSEMVLGTPAYMAPEQADSSIGAVGPAVDIYALGVILYETLTGRPPFRGENKQQTLNLVCIAEPMTLSQFRKDVPADLEAICLRCLEKSPRQRYASCQALALDLERLLRGEPTQARPQTWVRRTLRTLRRHRLKIVAAVVLVTVLGAMYFLNPRRALERLQANLDSGQSALLIDKTGWPKWHQCIHGENKTKFSQNPDGTFTIHTGSLCLVELLPDPRLERYCFRAKVKHHLASSLAGETGIYVGHRAFPGKEADLHLFLQMTFNDRWSPKDNNPVAHLLPPNLPPTATIRWYPHLYGGYKEGGTWMWDYPMEGGKAPRFVTGGLRPPWRDLAIMVTPEKVWGSWDGQAVGDLSKEFLKKTMAENIQRTKKHRPDDPTPLAVVPEFAPRGGLGLYVYLGSASFCDVSVTPLNVSQASSRNP